MLFVSVVLRISVRGRIYTGLYEQAENLRCKLIMHRNKQNSQNESRKCKHKCFQMWSEMKADHFSHRVNTKKRNRNAGKEK